MNKRILIAALAGGLAIFIGGSITHIMLPFSDWGLRPLPNELAAMETLQKLVSGPGVYIYPGMDGVNMNDQSAVSAYEQKIIQKPHGILVVAPPMGGLMPASKLAVQFIGDMLCGILATMLLSLTSLSGYVRRVAFISSLGLFTWFLTGFPFWNWYGFSSDFFVINGIDQALRCTFGGFAIAGVLRR